MSTIGQTISQLVAERARMAKEVAGLDAAIAALRKLGGGTAKAPAAKSVAKKGGMSAAGRARIVAAQKKRWAKVRAGKKGKDVAVKAASAKKPAKKKRTMSPAAIAKIRAAQKLRWEKIRAAKAQK